MQQYLGAVTVVVPSYEEGLRFYVGCLGFICVADVALSPGKRWEPARGTPS